MPLGVHPLRAGGMAAADRIPLQSRTERGERPEAEVSSLKWQGLKLRK